MAQGKLLLNFFHQFDGASKVISFRICRTYVTMFLWRTADKFFKLQTCESHLNIYTIRMKHLIFETSSNGISHADRLLFV